jgi:hypothetical protein
MSLPPKAASREIGANRPKSAELAHQTAHLHRKGEPDTDSRERARAHFLDVYALETPGLLRELCETVFPRYPEAGAASPNIELWTAVEYDHPELFNSLSQWALKFLLTFGGKPADWAMETALATLYQWQNSCRRFKCVQWRHRVVMHEHYPAGSPEYFNVSSGQSEAEADAEAFRIEIPPWNRAGDEERREFRRRAKEAIDEHERLMLEWTFKPDFSSWHHVTGLALWQAGDSLEMVRDRLASAGLNLGSPGDVSGITRGLNSAASFLEIDRRK